MSCRGFISGLGPAEGSPRESVPQGFLVSKPLFSPVPPVWGLLFSRCLRSLIEPRRALYIFNVCNILTRYFSLDTYFTNLSPQGELEALHEQEVKTRAGTQITGNLKVCLPAPKTRWQRLGDLLVPGILISVHTRTHHKRN